MLRPLVGAQRPSLHQQVSTCLLHAMHGHLWRHLDRCLADLLAESVASVDRATNVIDLAARREMPTRTVGRLLALRTGQARRDYRADATASERWQDRLDDRLLDWVLAWVRETADCSTRRAVRVADLLSDALTRQGLDETRWLLSRREMTLAQLRTRPTPTSHRAMATAAPAQE